MFPRCVSYQSAALLASEGLIRQSRLWDSIVKALFVKEVIDRLEEKMAIGQSRRAAKQTLRAAGEHVWAYSTERIHSFKTRTIYRGISCVLLAGHGLLIRL